MIKWSTPQEDITIINIYSFDIAESKYIQQIISDLPGVRDNNIIVGDFNTPLSKMDRSSRQKINKKHLDLN